MLTYPEPEPGEQLVFGFLANDPLYLGEFFARRQQLLASEIRYLWRLRNTPDERCPPSEPRRCGPRSRHVATDRACRSRSPSVGACGRQFRRFEEIAKALGALDTDLYVSLEHDFVDYMTGREYFRTRWLFRPRD